MVPPDASASDAVPMTSACSPSLDSSQEGLQRYTAAYVYALAGSPCASTPPPRKLRQSTRPSPLCSDVSAPAGESATICLRKPLASRVGRSFAPRPRLSPVSSAISSAVARLILALTASTCVRRLSWNEGRTRKSSALAAAAVFGGGRRANITSSASARDSSRLHSILPPSPRSESLASAETTRGRYATTSAPSLLTE